MNWHLFATVFFLISLYQVFAKILTDSTDASANDVEETAVLQPPEPYYFIEHEDWPHWLKRFGLRHIQH